MAGKRYRVWKIWVVLKVDGKLRCMDWREAFCIKEPAKPKRRKKT